MAKKTLDEMDIARRKPTIFVHARNHVDRSKEKAVAKPQRDSLNHEEALRSEMLLTQALVDILVTKGIFSRNELQERVEELRRTR